MQVYEKVYGPRLAPHGEDKQIFGLVSVSVSLVRNM